MEKIRPFGDFLSELILEKINQGELPIKLSKRLSTLLGEINHKIAKKLLRDESSDVSSKFTLIDLDDNHIDMFTYAVSPKIIEYIEKNTGIDDEITNLRYLNSQIGHPKNDIWSTNRSPIKIGKLVNKIYPDIFVNAGKPGEDIESFVNAIKSEREKYDGNFKIVKGQDIVKYYGSDYYDSGTYSPLHNSCMAYSHCAPYIGFYAHNNVELVILMGDKGDVIKGRAILWTITSINGRPVNRKFMDRVYTIQQHDVKKFLNLATQNGWLYKENQDMYDSTRIVDPLDDTTETRTLKIKGIEKYKAYPYMDTMKYFNMRGRYLTNDEDQAGSTYVTLESSDGGYYSSDSGEDLSYDEYTERLVSEDDMVWLDNEDRNMHRDHAVYSEYEHEWASPEYAEEHWKYSKLEDDWIPEEYMVYISSINQWVSDSYADEHFNRCDYDDEYYRPSEVLDSNSYNYVPKNKAVFVIDDDDVDIREYKRVNTRNYTDFYSIDVRYEGDKSYFTITHPKTGKEYHLDINLKGSELAKKIKKGVV